jgi:orotate phosphoribosyltransferase-like protein
MTKEEKRLFWEEKIPEYKTSGLSAKEWSSENNLSVHSLRYWILKFNKKNKSNESIEFKPLVSEVPSSQESPIRVCIGPAVIELTRGFDATTFERIVNILSRPC